MRRSPLAAIGSLLSDDTRAEILSALMDGRAHTGGELARHVGVSPSTASEHLSLLLDGGMVTVEAQGRYRYFRLAGPDVAELLERVGAAAPDGNAPLGRAPAARTPADLAYVRTCYDHLAGTLGVAIHDRLLAGGHVAPQDGGLCLTASGRALLTGLGVDTEALDRSRRPLVRGVPGLDGATAPPRRRRGGGAAHGAARQRLGPPGARPRSLRVTTTGRTALAEHLGVGD